MAPVEDVRESQIIKVTRQFYEWEQGARGWQLFDAPVLPEPPFIPFPGYYVDRQQVSSDDGHKPTFLSGLADEFFSLLAPKEKNTLDESYEESEPVDVEPSEANYSLPHEIQIILPSASQVSRDVFEQFLLSLTYCTHPLAFEIIGLPDSIVVQIVSSNDDMGQVRSQLSAYFPEASISVRFGFLRMAWIKAEETEETVIADFGLSQEFMLPLGASRKFDPDPFVGIIGALADVRDGEIAVFQVIFQPVKSPWAESILRAVMCQDGTPFFMNDHDFAGQTKTKLAKPLYGAVVRIAACGASRGRSTQIAKALASSLSVFSNPSGNELIPLENDQYDSFDHEEDLLLRQSRRSGMILNSDELISLVHLPSASVRTQKLERQIEKTKAAPESAANSTLTLGENFHLGKTKTVTLSPEQRVCHTHVIGVSGTGKSTLLLDMILQDIRNGEGIAVLDPHGDLIDKVLENIPEERFKDVVLLDPSDEEYAIGFNILSAHSDLEKNLLASDLTAGFKRLSTSWGDQMTSVMGNAVMAFLESEQGGTLADLRRFLIEPSFRESFLKTVKDPEIVYYWTRAYPLLSGKPQAPIITRLDTFLRPKPIRRMVSQKENRLNFAEMMNEGKIFLAKLSQGAIGEENAHLLGTLLVSKFHQLVMGRQEIKQEKRKNFWLYIDEFHHFITPSMSAIISGARKYRLGLILAHQEWRQLESRDPDVASAVLTCNVRVCFRLGDQDAKKLESGFSFFNMSDLQKLETGEAICRIGRSDFDFNLTTKLLPEVDVAVAEKRRQEITALSREKYAVHRKDVEIQNPVQVDEKPPVETQKPKEKESVREETPPAPTPVHNASPAYAPPKKENVERPKPVEPGRGGEDHKRVQHLIKRYADGLGFLSVIEKPILDGKGSVDVALEKGGCSIACQISVTTPVDQEVSNVKKCLLAGFSCVALICADVKKLNQLRNSIAKEVSEEEIKRVDFFSPDEILLFIQQLALQSMSSENTVRGYRVKVNYRSGDNQEIRQQAISEVIVNAIKKLKGTKK